MAMFSVGHTLGTLGIHGLPGVVGVGVEVEIISFMVYIISPPSCFPSLSRAINLTLCGALLVSGNENLSSLILGVPKSVNCCVWLFAKNICTLSAVSIFVHVRVIVLPALVCVMFANLRSKVPGALRTCDEPLTHSLPSPDVWLASLKHISVGDISPMILSALYGATVT